MTVTFYRQPTVAGKTELNLEPVCSYHLLGRGQGLDATKCNHEQNRVRLPEPADTSTKNHRILHLHIEFLRAALCVPEKYGQRHLEFGKGILLQYDETHLQHDSGNNKAALQSGLAAAKLAAMMMHTHNWSSTHWHNNQC